MAINERLVHTASAGGSGAAEVEQGLILHLDANDVDSYDGDGPTWYDISEYDVTIPISDNADDLELHLNASDATSYGGTGTTWTDISGNSRNGTIGSTVAATFDKDNGGYFDFRGSSTNDQVSIPYNSALDLTSSGITIELWCKPDTTGYECIYNGTGSGSPYNGIQLFFHTGFDYYVYSGGTSRATKTSGGSTVSTSEWGHYVFTIDGTASGSNVKSYINGELDSSTTLSAAYTGSTADILLGNYTIATGNYDYDGKLGVARIYSKALSASEVGQNYRHGRDTVYTDLAGTPFIHYDPADTNSYSGTGTTLTDLAGNNNGDLLGGIESSYDEELGNSFDMTGSGDGITTSSPVSINPNTSGMSIELWFKLDADNYCYLFAFDGTGTTGFGLSYRANVDQVWWFYRIGATTNDNLYSSTISLNTWHHIVATTDGSTGELYLNGQLVDSSTSAPHSITYNEDLHFGNMYDLAQNNNTQIGQIRFYKAGLSADEVMQNYLFTKNDYPNEFHGTINGTSFLPGTGGEVDAFDFNGSNNSVSLNSSAFSQNTYTIAAWFKLDTLNLGGIFEWGDATSYERRGLIVWNGGSGNYKLYSSSYASNVPANTSLAANVWYHGAVTMDNGSASLYLNGQPDGTGTNTLATYTGITAYVGRTQVGEYLNGKVSEVKVYNKVLTASEIEALYNEGNG